MQDHLEHITRQSGGRRRPLTMVFPLARPQTRALDDANEGLRYGPGIHIRDNTERTSAQVYKKRSEGSREAEEENEGEGKAGLCCAGGCGEGTAASQAGRVSRDAGKRDRVARVAPHHEPERAAAPLLYPFRLPSPPLLQAGRKADTADAFDPDAPANATHKQVMTSRQRI